MMRAPGGGGGAPAGPGGAMIPRGGGGGGDPRGMPGGNQNNNNNNNDDDSYSYDEEEDAEEDEVPWVVWFCGLKGNEFFCEVDEEYIRDDFNLTGLSLMVPFFDNAVEMILDLDSPQDERLTEEQQRLVDSSAETLYGLIHARFILTPRGLKLMEEKYRAATFGRCPRVSCGGHPVLPVGQSDVVRESSVKLYCPKCRELYFPRSARHKALDGAFWGTSFPHLLLLTLYDGPPPVDSSAQNYVPRIFGFRVRDPRAAAAAAANKDGGGDGGSPVAAITDRAAAEKEKEQAAKHADPMAAGGRGSPVAGRAAGAASPAPAAGGVPGRLQPPGGAASPTLRR